MKKPSLKKGFNYCAGIAFTGGVIGGTIAVAGIVTSFFPDKWKKVISHGQGLNLFELENKDREENAGNEMGAAFYKASSHCIGGAVKVNAAVFKRMAKIFPNRYGAAYNALIKEHPELDKEDLSPEA